LIQAAWQSNPLDETANTDLRIEPATEPRATAPQRDSATSFSVRPDSEATQLEFKHIRNIAYRRTAGRKSGESSTNFPDLSQQTTAETASPRRSGVPKKNPRHFH